MDYTKLDEFLGNKQQGEVVVPANQYFSNIQMPDSWETLDSFIAWYLDSRMPLMVPWDSSTSSTENTTSMSIFRKFPYLVEMCMVHPGCSIPAHAHPGTRVQIMLLGGGENYAKDPNGLCSVSESWGEFKQPINDGQHYKLGDINNTNTGLAFLIFSRWPSGWKEKYDNFVAGTITQWQGNTFGPIHEKYIKDFVEGAVAENGHADIYGKEKVEVHDVIDLDTAPIRSKLSPNDYYKDLVIPDDWLDLEDFASWWIKNKMPMLVPWNAEVIISDDATAICVFRKGQYQVEFYVEHPFYSISSHCHPGMEVITLYLAGGENCPTGPNTFFNTANRWGRVKSRLNSGEYHGGEDTTITSGFVLIAIQKWDEGIKVASAAVNWKGDTAGPKQDSLIKRHRPDAFTRTGYADVSLKS
jgi:hypothetical protein